MVRASSLHITSVSVSTDAGQDAVVHSRTKASDDACSTTSDFLLQTFRQRRNQILTTAHMAQFCWGLLDNGGKICYTVNRVK